MEISADEDSFDEDMPTFWNVQKLYQAPGAANEQANGVKYDSSRRRSSLSTEEFRMNNNVSPSQLMSLFKVSNDDIKEKKSPSLKKKLSTRFGWSKNACELDQTTTSLRSHSTRIANKSPNNCQRESIPPPASLLTNRRNTISNIAFNKIYTPTPIRGAVAGNGSSGGGIHGLTSNTIALISKSDENFHNDKLKINELFDLVEQADIDNLKKLLDTHKHLVNSHDQFDLTPLDIAIMLNHAPLFRLLLQYDAKESKKWSQVEGKYERVCEHFEEQKLHQKKYKTLKRMKETFEQAERPGAPTNVQLHVTGKSHLTVTFDEPLRNNGALITKYKVAWSFNGDFNKIDGEVTLTAVVNKEYQIKNLSTGVYVYVRVSCFNIKGWSEPALSEPRCATPSCWREGLAVYERILRGLFKLNELCNDMQSSKKEIEKSSSLATCMKDELKTRKTKSLRKNLFNLFTVSSASNQASTCTDTNDGINIFGSCHTFSDVCVNNSTKFIKQIKKNNAYLVILVFDNERIVVTGDDNYPIIEIDENYHSTSLKSDLQFLLKISINLEDINELKSEMDKTIYTSNLQFRYKLLKIACYIKNLFQFQENARVHYQTLKDSNGNIFFVLTKKQTNLQVPSNLKSTNLNKLLAKISTNNENRSCCDTINRNLERILDFEQVDGCQKQLAKGLYLVYLKIQSSIDEINILVSNQRPYMLPYVKISNNPNISQDEWIFLKRLQDEIRVNFHDFNLTSENFKSQENFLNSLIQAFKSLITLFEIDEREASNLRVYTHEAIEISKDITLLVVYPPADQIFNMQNDDLSHNSPHTAPSTPTSQKSNLFFNLSVKNFEAIHLLHYNQCFFKTYSKLSIALDIEYQTALQFQREAFSNDEIDLTKQKLTCIGKYQARLDEIWKESRWFFEAINVARDRSKQNELSYGNLVESMSLLEKLIHNSTKLTLQVSFKTDLVKQSKIVRIKTNKSLSSVSSSTSASTLSSPLLSQNSLFTPFENNIEQVDYDRYFIDRQEDSKTILVFLALKNISCVHVSCPISVNTTTMDIILYVLDTNGLISGRISMETKNQIDNYYSLVILLNSRERVLRSDYCLAQLQEPWSNGRFYLRETRDVLAVLKLDFNQNYV